MLDVKGIKTGSILKEIIRIGEKQFPSGPQRDPIERDFNVIISLPEKWRCHH